MDRAKCYTSVMIEFLQSHIFGAMFGVGVRLNIPSPPDKDEEEVLKSRHVIHGTRVNVITHVLPVAYYGHQMNNFRRA
jgi:hypothetical protein